MTARLRTPVMGAVLLAAAVALAGCAGTGGSSGSTRGGSAVGPTGGGAAASGNRPARSSEPAAPSRSGVVEQPPKELDPAVVPQSTFAMDVDTASYDHARSLLEQGQLPDPAGVRPEEFVNAFRQDYPQPPGDGFSVTLDGARLPEQQHPVPAGDVRLLRVGLQTRADDPAARPDAALTVVVDVSGSMGEPGKLALVQQALHTFVDQARPSDSLAIVTFNEDAHVLRPMTAVRERAVLHAAIDELAAEGSTNLEGGLVQGYQVAREGFRPGATNRVVLLSDALANVGETDAGPILAQVREAAAKQITLLGVAVGNDYGDALMEQLADSGDGFVVYVSSQDAARRAFLETLPAARSVRALDAKVQVTFDAATVAGYHLIGYEDRALRASAFRDDRVDGGEVPAGHSVTALYTVRLRPGAAGHVAHTQLRWQDPHTRAATETGADVGVADLDGPFTRAGARLQVSWTAAFLAEQLRHSDYGRQVSREQLAQAADAAAARTEDPAVRALAAAVRSLAEAR